MTHNESREVGFTVKVHGKKVKEYSFKGNRYIWAKNKTEYSILCWNNTARRVEVVLSVDGLNILTGKSANTHDTGYIIDPFSSIEIPGYRLNGESVARFTFGKNEDSYAAKMDKPMNIGVIGAAFHYEYKPVQLYVPLSINPPTYWYDGSYAPRSITYSGNTGGGGGTYSCMAPQSVECNNSCFVSSVQEEPSIGTVFGDKTEFNTTTVNFTRDYLKPPVLLSLYYKSREELEKMGINLKKKRVMVAKPNPFPANHDGCTPPPGWTVH